MRDIEAEESCRSRTEALNPVKGVGPSEAHEHSPTTAHTVDNDSWLQVGLMLVTGFSSGYILSMSSLTMKPLGWGWGLSCLLLVGFFSAYANWALAGFHFIQGQRFIRYRDLMGFLFGRELYYITWVFQFLTLILINMGFILLGGRALKEINLGFSNSPLRLQYYIAIAGMTYFIFANAVPTMSAMRWWLGVSAISTFAFIAICMVPLVKDGISNTSKDYEIGGSTLAKVFNAFGAISAMVAASNTGFLPEIQSTLRTPQVKNMRMALILQFSVGIMVYYGVYVMGYWAYGSEVSDYLPTQLSGSKWTKALINSSVFIQSFFSQHMFAVPVHEALDTKFLKLNETTYSRENFKRRLILRALFFMGNTFVAAAFPFIGDFVNFMGSFTLIPLTFVFPSMIFIRVKGHKANMKKKVWHWTLIVVFSLLALVTTFSAIQLIISNVREYHVFADT